MNQIICNNMKTQTELCFLGQYLSLIPQNSSGFLLSLPYTQRATAKYTGHLSLLCIRMTRVREPSMP